MTQRTVTGTIRKLDGTAWTGGDVIWTLIDVFVTATETYLPMSQTIQTDAQGQFSQELGVPETGTAHYQVTLPDERIYDMFLASGTTVDLAELITTDQAAVSQNDLQTLLDQASVLVAYSITSARVMDGSEDLIEFTAGTFAQTLPAATGSKKPVAFVNSGSGVITLTAAGSDTISGAATSTLAAGLSVVLVDIAAGRWIRI